MIRGQVPIVPCENTEWGMVKDTRVSILKFNHLASGLGKYKAGRGSFIFWIAMTHAKFAGSIGGSPNEIIGRRA